jgi:hypothetical protein
MKMLGVKTMEDFKKEKKFKKYTTTLNLDDLAGRAEKPANNLVVRKNRSHGFIRQRKRNGRITFEWVRNEYRGSGLPPRQVLIKYIGPLLPPGVRLGRVDEKTAEKLSQLSKGG